MAIATSMHVTPADVLDYLLTLTPTEETLAYGSGRGQLRRLTFLLDYTPAWLSPLPLYQCLNAGRPGVLYESVDIAPIYGRYSLAVIDPPVIVEGKDERFRIRALNRRGQDILAQTLSDEGRDAEALQFIERAAELGGPFASAVEETRKAIRARLKK